MYVCIVDPLTPEAMRGYQETETYASLRTDACLRTHSSLRMHDKQALKEAVYLRTQKTQASMHV